MIRGKRVPRDGTKFSFLIALALPLYTGAVPMQQLNLKPTHKLVKSYYEVLGQFGQLNIDHEMAVRSVFQGLLAGCGRQFDLTLVPEYSFQPPKLHAIRVDGALLNPFRLARGYWEAKDEHDDLEKEIRAKLERGYPRSNSVFQDSPGEAENEWRKTSVSNFANLLVLLCRKTRSRRQVRLLGPRESRAASGRYPRQL